jgi:hypothetical protein
LFVLVYIYARRQIPSLNSRSGIRLTKTKIAKVFSNEFNHFAIFVTMDSSFTRKEKT